MTEFFYTLILLGAIQGIIIGCLLFFSRNRQMDSRLLAILIWLIALPGVHLYFHYRHWFDLSYAMEIAHGILPLVLIMPIGPLIFFYMRSQLEPDFKLSKGALLHFIPTSIDLFPKLVEIGFLIGSAIGWLAPNRAPVTEFINDYNQYADIPRWISLTIYVVAAARYLKSHRSKREGEGERTAGIRWLQQFIRVFAAFQVIWLIYLVPYILPVSSAWLMANFDWFPVYLPLAFLIYWLGFKGYAKSLSYRSALKKQKNTPRELSRDLIEETVLLLKSSMEMDRLYLDPALSLSRLSEQTGLPGKTISAVLNQYLHTNFNEFINKYRMDEFKKRLATPEGDLLTIAGIAAECGFNSPATFQRTFKQLTGISPTEYRKGRVTIK